MRLPVILGVLVGALLTVVPSADQSVIRIRALESGGGGGNLLDWEDDFTYLGAARLSQDFNDGCTPAYAEFGSITLSSSSTFYFTEGSCIKEFNIPTLRTDADPSSLNVATTAQSFIVNYYTDLYNDLGADMTSGMKLGTLVKYGSWLYVCAHGYYGTATDVSCFRMNPTLSSATYPGAVKVWAGDATITGTTQGFLASRAAHVPAAWQSALGGPVVFNGQCMPIVTRTSNGPSLFSLDPSNINVQTPPVTAYALLYYPGDVFAPYSGASAKWGGTSCIAGVALIDGTNSAVFLGTNGTGTWCYGATPTPCTDPEQPSTGGHAYPYQYQYWLYDINDFVQVKNGSILPWAPEPYAYGNFTLPYTQAKTVMIGTDYDPSNKRLYFLQARAEPVTGDKVFPVLHAYYCSGCP